MPLLTKRLLLSTFLLPLMSCALPSADDSPRSASDEPPLPAVSRFVDPLADDPTLDAAPVEVTDLERRWSCEDKPYTCADDYFAYPGRAAEFARPVSDCAGLRWTLERMAVGELPTPRWTDPLNDDELAERVIDGAAIAHLLDGMSDRPLQVTTIGDEVRPVMEDEPGSPTYRQIELLFEDPYVAATNEIHALLLLPEGDGPFPGVVAMPGHHELAADFRDLRYGKYFPMHGYALLIITPRGYGDEETEDGYTEQLLCAGFTSVGLRVYEALLGFRYLRLSALTAGAPISVIGHSGGSATVNLLARIAAPVHAVITDIQSWYLGFSGYYGDGGEYYDYGRYLVDETAPGVIPFSEHINAFETARMPILQLPYAYGDPALDPEFPPDPDPDDPDRYKLLFDFLDKTLQGSTE